MKIKLIIGIIILSLLLVGCGEMTRHEFCNEQGYNAYRYKTRFFSETDFYCVSSLNDGSITTSRIVTASEFINYRNCNCEINITNTFNEK